MIITDCLGRQREPTQVWPDGSHTCPFCGAAAESTGCRNPACFANVDGFSPERARQLIAEQEARDAERVRQEEIAAFRKAYAAERAEAEAKRQAELAAECAARGACERCLFAPGWQYVKPRFVKHRKACPRA